MRPTDRAVDIPRASTTHLSPARSRANVRADHFADDAREDPFLMVEDTDSHAERWYADEVAMAV